MDNRKIVFNNRAPLSVEEPTLSVFADDPAVLLEETKIFSRNATQLTKLASLPNSVSLGPDRLFDTDLTWAYRAYIVHLLSAPGVGENAVLPLGLAPSQPIALEALQPDGSASPATGAEQDSQDLYLFNVIVALEWYPSQRYLRQLRWAFRRASDFLYDVTDGFMAFGQVVFGGPELMDCADIQIMASNRLLPRSWVSGLHTPEKYMPIRAGRGIWHKNNHVTIPWDEPEAYRTLIHEWSHYALELRDQYLELREVGPASSSGDVLMDDRGSEKVVVPQISLALETIMATLEGTSELVPRDEASSAERKTKVWEYIADKGHFPSAKPHQPLDGPGCLPLPLPRFRYLGKLAGAGEPAGQASAGSAAAEPSEGLRFDPPEQIDAEHCWVYVLRGPQDKPTGLIAQGTLDARSKAEGFRLFGTEKDDTVVLIGHAPDDGAPIVLRNRIADTEPALVFAGAVWEVATPAVFPMIDVLPEQVNGSDRMADISICITVPDQSLPDQVVVFPLGDPSQNFSLDRAEAADSEVWLSQPIRVPTLDGHVLVRWGDKLVISAFSQGGGPLTNTPVGPPPISAGSSEGNLMLFFGNETTMDDPSTAGPGENYSDVRVVTTVIHGMEQTVWNAGQARSYTFSLASTKSLPTDFNPTLIMHYDTVAAHYQGDLIVCRQKGAGSWERLPTYCRPGSSFAAVPLNQPGAGGTLVASESQARCIERYRLYWLPRAPAQIV